MPELDPSNSANSLTGSGDNRLPDSSVGESQSNSNLPPESGDGANRWHVYRLLIVISAIVMIARIMSTVSDNGETPFLSANDRSRWCTIRALGDHGTYKIDQVIWAGDRFDPNWNSIDKVVHFGEDGNEHFYSSKPTLLTTLLSFEYLLLSGLTDWSLTTHTFEIARLMLIFSNVLPMILMFVLLGLLVERYARTNWTRYFVMASATFGTFLTSFAVTINNHLPAAVSVMVACYCLLAIWNEGKRHWGYFLIAGLAAAFTAANELPALSFLCLVGLICLIKDPRQTLLVFAPATLVVAAGFFGTNYLAHQTWKPAYAHRSDGPLLATVETDLRSELESDGVPAEIREAANSALALKRQKLSDESLIEPALLLGDNDSRRWTLLDEQSGFRLAIVETKPGEEYQIRAWENWYEYPNSYWIPGRKGPIDQGEPSSFAYAFHMLVGHHGIFSLTPIWIFSLLGMGLGLFRKEWRLQGFILFSAMLLFVVFSFYASRPLEDRNYGGVTSGLRWMFWFTPMLLLTMIPACDRIASNRGWRSLAEVALGFSIFSTLFSPLNPWTHPWIYQLLFNDAN